MSCEELLLERLRARGLRLTPQRELVLAALHHVESPATAEEIYTRVHAVSASVDISTVYRTLELFQEFQTNLHESTLIFLFVRIGED